MSAALYALGRWAFRMHRRVLVLWLVALAVLFAGAGLLGQGTDNTYSIPGTESQDALDALARTFPQVSGSSAQLIAVAPDGGSVTDAGFEAAVTAAAATIAAIPQVSSATVPYGSSSTANISADSSAVIVPIQLSVATTAVLPTTADALQAAGVALQAALPPGSEVAVGGQLFAQSPAGISITELLGIAVAFVVLFLTFGSLVAAGLPLITALLGVGASLAIVLAATSVLTITSTTPLLALMLGLAVGIDYALFIISRHQDQLRHGLEPEESAARAVATSGSAVVFAAITVIIALLGLAVAGIPFLSIMGVAAALAVAIAVLISITLTPALLGFARWRVVAKRYRPAAAVPEAPGDAPAEVPGDVPVDAAERPGRFFPAWARAVTRWPLVTVLAVVVLLGLAAVPALSLRLALPDAGSLDEGTPGRVTYDLVAEHFGPGFNGPLIVTGSVIQSTDPVGLMDNLGAEIAAVPGVASVPLSTPNEAGDTGIVQVIPDGAPDSEATAELVATLRSMHAQFEQEYGVSLSVTGYTAAGIDISARLAGALLPFGLLVVGLSLVLLAMVFRSIVVPITAALGYALSIGAAFGLTALVFIDGFLAEPLNVAGLGSVISFMPIIVMGVLFGLAMDYEVFLVSRMREEYVQSHDPGGAVHGGFVASARVVTAAAIIMFAVFAAFVPEGEANIQPIAFGLAVGVAIDAFLVRMTLIPAVLVLFGHRAWWFPAWLDRALPRFDIEGEGLAAEFALADWPEPGDRLAIAAEGVRTAETPPVGTDFDAQLAAGGALLVEGGTPAERSALLLALGGRAPVLSGRLKVCGFVQPTRAAAARACTAYVRVDRSADAVDVIRDALHGDPEIVMIDVTDTVLAAATREQIRQLLTERLWGAARHGRPLPSIVLAEGAGTRAGLMLPEGTALQVARLAAATPAVPSPPAASELVG
ncbi:MMPL family transporter [Microterricola pindariensis]|uniref:Transporter n=1 Tax=Microterricola pindariensis TaxID=478010 RepID=A0ABX5AYH0_9MICO|nr:MMPL family transporter [Microterricola pindariensis]PPL19938.1 transporter [Microterricola pindariensis]